MMRLDPSQVISYGPCQFPTLGFIVDRFNAIRKFVSEPFWDIDCKIDVKNSNGEVKKCTLQWT
jgi:DNA topoisomerase-3